MAFVRDPKLILDKMKAEQLRFYSVLDSDGKSVIDEVDDEDIDSSESQDRLSDLLYSLEGLVYVTLRGSSKKKRAQGGDVAAKTYRYSIRLGNAVTSQQSGSNSGIAGFGEIFKLMNEKHAMEMAALRKEMELREEMKELRRMIEEGNNQGIEKYLPLLQNIFNSPTNMSTPRTIGIAGNDQDAVEDKKAILSDAISRLYKVDPELHNTLAKLAAFAEQNPTKFKMYLQML